MIFIYIFLTVYVILTLLLIGYDFFRYQIENLSHYHIGRWDNIQNWEDAVGKVCKKWAIKTPKLQINDYYRYLLLDKLKGTYSKAMVQSWQTAGCLLGLLEQGRFAEIEIVKKQLIDSKGNWKIKINRVDFAMLAFVLLNAETNPEEIRPAMDEMITCIEVNICKDGMVSYSAGPNGKRRYVDTLGFVCPFLVLYANTYKVPQYEQIAIDQYRKFRQYGLMKGLPVHCFEIDTYLPIGVYGWGRGIGWYTLGLIDMYPKLSSEKRGEVMQWIYEIAESARKFERKDGGFSTIIQTEHHHDSSATAMLGYFYAKCAVLFKESIYADIADNCRQHLIRVTKFNGVIDEALGDTKDIGVFSQRYGGMPFMQGMALRLSVALRDNKERR